MGARLRRSLVLTALAALASYPASAQAADVEVDPSFDYSWSGFYIGAYAGAGAHLLTGEIDVPVFQRTNDSGGGDGFLAGAMAGFNWQISDRVVLGLQGDIGFYDMETLEFVTFADYDPQFIASASLRAGYLMTPGTLFYLIGGYSYAEFDIDDGQSFFDLSDHETFDGFHVGAGMETRLTDRLTARIEYRYTEFGGEESDALGDVEATPRFHTGTLGLAFNLFPTAGEGEEISPAADVAEPQASWTGFYLGLNGGAGAFVTDEIVDDGVTPGGDGFIGSAMAGVNWQAGEHFVLGLQGDVGLAENMEWDLDRNIPAVLSDHVSLELDWFASASLRAGWLVDPLTMIYVIGGYSYAEFNYEDSSTLFAVSSDKREDFEGYHIGAGIEAMLTDNLTARVEYRYTDYGGQDVELFGGALEDFHFDPSTHTGTIGIAWLFNGL